MSYHLHVKDDMQKWVEVYYKSFGTSTQHQWLMGLSLSFSARSARNVLLFARTGWCTKKCAEIRCRTFGSSMKLQWFLACMLLSPLQICWGTTNVQKSQEMMKICQTSIKTKQPNKKREKSTRWKDPSPAKKKKPPTRTDRKGIRRNQILKPSSQKHIK